MLIDDEDDLRSGLRALTAPVPPQPAERVAHAVGRARRIRRRRAAVTSLAVLLPAVAVGALVLRPTPPPRTDFTNVANWPERRDPGFGQIERNVLAEWDYSPLNELGADETVRWLYSGRVPGTDTVVVAFATCRPGQCTRTVLAYGDQAEMAEPPEDDSSTGWLTRTRDLAPGERIGALSEYLDSASRPEEGPTTVLFVLAPPDAEQVMYLAPTRDGTGSSSGPLGRAGGAFVRDVGYLEADAVITVTRRDGSFAHQGTVGDGDSVGNARLIRGLDLPSGYDEDSGTSGQVADGVTMVNGAAGRKPHALFVRCVGAAPLRVELNGSKGTVPCDGRPRQATPFVAPVVMEHGEDDLALPSFEYRVDGDDPYAVYVVALAKRV